MAADNACPICLDPYTATLRKKIECPQCHESTCIKCVERYMMSTIEDPHCAHCRYGWNRAFLNTFCTQTFLNKTYFKYRQDILMNRERSYLPDAMVRVEREKRATELERTIPAIYAKETAIRREYEAKITAIRQEYEAKITAIRREYEAKVAVFARDRQRIWARAERIRTGMDEDVADDAPAAGGAGAAASTSTKRKFIRRCTSTGCTGFLSSVWKCGICENWICPDCFEVKGKEKDVAHTCKPELLETANLIRKDTKPCPSCGEMIMKVDGCDQMWCTSCHTPFSWTSGQIFKSGAVHNPHYYQWIRNGGGGGAGAPQAPGFIPCGGFPDAHNIRRSLRLIPQQELNHIMYIHMICLHISDIERQRYRVHHGVQNNEDINVRYLLKQITEDEWKQALAKEEKARQKSREIRDILDAFVGAAIDIMRRIDIRPENPYERSAGLSLALEISTEMAALRDYMVGELAKISKAFNCSVPYIDNEWNVRHGNIGPTKSRAAAATATATVAPPATTTDIVVFTPTTNTN